MFSGNTPVSRQRSWSFSTSPPTWLLVLVIVSTWKPTSIQNRRGSSRTSGWRPWTNWTSASCHLTKPFSVPWRMRTYQPMAIISAREYGKTTTWRPWKSSWHGTTTKTSNPCWKPSTRCFSLTTTDVLICLKTTSAFPDSSWSTCPKTYQTLGIYFGHDKEECERLNWENKIEKMNNLLLLWTKRNLTILGEILIIKFHYSYQKATFKMENHEQ